MHAKGNECTSAEPSPVRDMTLGIMYSVAVTIIGLHPQYHALYMYKPGLQKGSIGWYALDLQISDLRVGKEPGQVTMTI
jgi:hypothetical protein